MVKTILKEGTVMSNLSKLSWIFPLFVLVLFVFGMFIALIIREKRKAVRFPIMAGLICYALVLIFEICGAKAFGDDIYVTYVGLEEGLEMIGGSFFLLSVLNRKSVTE